MIQWFTDWFEGPFTDWCNCRGDRVKQKSKWGKFKWTFLWYWPQKIWFWFLCKFNYHPVHNWSEVKKDPMIIKDFCIWCDCYLDEDMKREK